MDKQEALDALDEMVSALRALLPGAESMGWDTGNARTAISNSEIIRAHLTDPGYVRVPEGWKLAPIPLLKQGAHFAGRYAETLGACPESCMDDDAERLRRLLRTYKKSVNNLLATAPAPTDELAKLRERVKELEGIISDNHIDIRKQRQSLAYCESSAKAIIMQIVCIGGPLNDNKLQYSPKQLGIFHQIKMLSAEIESAARLREGGYNE